MLGEVLQGANCINQQHIFDITKATHNVGENAEIGIAVKAASPTQCVLKCKLKSRVGFFQEKGGKCLCLTNDEIESQIVIGGKEDEGGVDSNNGILYQERKKENTECPEKG